MNDRRNHHVGAGVADIMASLPKPPEPTPRELELEKQLETIRELLGDDEYDPVRALRMALRESDTAQREVRMLRARDRVQRGTRVLAELERPAWREYAKHALEAEILGQHLSPQVQRLDELAAQRAAARYADAMLELEARRFDDIPDDLTVLDTERVIFSKARDEKDEP